MAIHQPLPPNLAAVTLSLTTRCEVQKDRWYCVMQPQATEFSLGPRRAHKGALLRLRALSNAISCGPGSRCWRLAVLLQCQMKRGHPSTSRRAEAQQLLAIAAWAVAACWLHQHSVHAAGSPALERVASDAGPLRTPSQALLHPLYTYMQPGAYLGTSNATLGNTTFRWAAFVDVIARRLQLMHHCRRR